ncbi:hypothetical protein O9929_10520 [Vibrio lentus]|nr:hypothetical protein [Vibrio lentus]
MIDLTEALTSIDINSARATKGRRYRRNSTLTLT